ncbi:MAG: DUF2281 domain-containing protein [Methylococcales bacterium]|nr:DUF2281 domain-containing protein [Methylococcales bacterium]
MTVAETIYEKINLLPDDKQQEVFDFIDFISSRYNKKQAITTNEELTDDIFVNFSMHHALRGIEDDPVSYSTEDLKERWL